MDTITIPRKAWEDARCLLEVTQSALAKLVHQISVPLNTPLAVLAVADVADRIAAEDSTFEGLSEFADHTPIPYTVTPRTFERGDIIPDDVRTIELSGIERKDFRYVNRKANGNFGYLHTLHGWGESDTGPTGNGYWQPDDFPLTEVIDPVLFTLGEAVAHLQMVGIDTDAARLAKYLNNSIAWTDIYGRPRGCASNYVVDVSDDFADSDVAFTSAGLSVLVSMMRKAAA